MLMNFKLVELGEGQATFAVDPAECHFNPIGVVQSGKLYAHATTTCLILKM